MLNLQHHPVYQLRTYPSMETVATKLHLTSAHHLLRNQIHPLDLMTKEVERDNHRDRDLDSHSSSNEDQLNDLQEDRELQEVQALHLGTNMFHQEVQVSSALHCVHARFHEQCSASSDLPDETALCHRDLLIPDPGDQLIAPHRDC